MCMNVFVCLHVCVQIVLNDQKKAPNPDLEIGVPEGWNCVGPPGAAVLPAPHHWASLQPPARCLPPLWL